MKRGHIWLLVVGLLFVGVVLLLSIGKLGINGYSVYDGKFDNLALQKNAGITGNSVFEGLWNKLFRGDGQEEKKVNLLAPPSGRTIYVDKDRLLTGACNNNWEGNITNPKCDIYPRDWFMRGLEPGDTVYLNGNESTSYYMMVLYEKFWNKRKSSNNKSI